MADSDRHRENRADPDALLALADKQERGRLTVFLGAAPGVGKTYAMLSRARRVKEDGGDILIGLVETHGRGETAALLEGVEILPRRKIAYRGHTIEEFDLDAALARHPQTIVVDELAHTNAPDSRHPKRYQDIDELLAAGINVWTALNIQHLESLSDVVAQITGVPVREQIPDTVLKKADEVLLVDLPPAELLERLKEGKVYLPANAVRAADSFFRLGNLTALRDLALRRTADRVDDQMVDYLKQNAIEGPWPSAERLLVCIGPDALSEKVVRTASRLASGLNAHWLVASIEPVDRAVSDQAGERRLDETFRLAERLGAETRRVKGADFVDEILRLARREHATQIVIGGRKQSFPFRLFRRSLPDALMERASGLGVYVVTGEEEMPPPAAPAKPRALIFRILKDVGLAAAMTAAVTILGLALDEVVRLPNISIIYLLAVLASAISAGYAAAIAAALFSALAYNFFFIPPIYTLTIAEPHEVFALFVFLAAAMLTGGLTSRLREQAKVSGERAITTQALYDYSRKLSGTSKQDDVVWATVTQLQGALSRTVALLLPDQGELRLQASWPPDTELGVSDMAAARWAFEKREEAGSGTGTLPNSVFRFIPLTSPHGVVGVCGIQQNGEILDGSEERMLIAILDQSAVAIDRARLSKERLQQAAALEGERFRSALLASVSHDLKTPLATITGAITSLREFGDKMDKGSRDDLLVSIDEESARLARFLANLLDMTRIESGSVEAKRDWVDVVDVVRSAVERSQKAFPGRAIEVQLAPELPLIRGDSVLLGQVLFNLIDNADKYGGADPIRIYARQEKDEVTLSVVDMGKGIPENDLDQIFEKFFRRGKPDGRAPGTGLGLPIARGFVEAMGGTIKAESPAQKRKGTRMILRFPVEAVPAETEVAS
ncbi:MULTISPECIES: sensor histidine kinase [Phyllobacteriaceae]|jgi:two-component system, OmpR family, sensor histidine kinase KdpD|uniref:histidine kinase n=2 Tax=Hyphomicrobiales TaxID=356 RepID=A0A1C2DDT7_9HYPH|nr:MULTISPECIES: sensor histidine kinase KdpD [Mesorhizobium]MBN9234992.1 sensor histidine kinase KdpD [Mesorhizobium sp.]OCX12796.1 histidine kinase [Mesorhizobium hungaricum]